MDSYWESQSLSSGYHTSVVEDEALLPLTKEPVTVLGRQYSALYDREEIRTDIVSRIWCTYRRGFPPISGPGGFSSDVGWGCMHRCGQMMLAQALLITHLGRDWRWYKDIDDEVYHRILSLFRDSRQANYSIHMISTHGQLEGKTVGKWFGPNTVAQVLKKLAKGDKWTKLKIHITMEDGIIIDEIVSLCTKRNLHKSKRNQSKSSTKNQPIAQSQEIDDNCVEIVLPPTSDPDESRTTDSNVGNNDAGWHPLLLIVPVRLGLNELNQCYIPALKEVLKLPQSVGILGGRPSHALWFMGAVGDELLYLDPHETQPAVIRSPVTGAGDEDGSYHCSRWGRIQTSRLDPSMALGFLASSHAALLELCEQLKKRVLLPAGDHPMFEIHQRRPHYFPPAGSLYSVSVSEAQDSADEFELL